MKELDEIKTTLFINKFMSEITDNMSGYGCDYEDMIECFIKVSVFMTKYWKMTKEYDDETINILVDTIKGTCEGLDKYREEHPDSTEHQRPYFFPEVVDGLIKLEQETGSIQPLMLILEEFKKIFVPDCPGWEEYCFPEESMTDDGLVYEINI